MLIKKSKQDISLNMAVFLIFGITLRCFAITTMLNEAELIAKIYEQEIAKAPPPSPFPLTEPALELSSTWFHCNPDDFAYGLDENPITALVNEPFWKLCRDIGLDGFCIEGIRKTGAISIQPNWNLAWPQITKQAQKYDIALLHSLIGNASVAGPDFQEALRNDTAYLSLYHTIEIDPSDWKYLPQVPDSSTFVNVPWLSLQTLQKQGYIPEQDRPYTKESAWNATNAILGVDGKIRRWIYLKEGQNDPTFAWLSPSFSAYQIATADACNSIKELDCQILQLDDHLPSIAKNMLSLWIRKIGGFSVSETNGTLESLQAASSDLFYDTVTPAPLLHALITQNAESLRMIYKMLLENHIDTKKLVHRLQPLDRYACDWVELTKAPKKKFSYFEEQITGEVLKQRLLKEDLLSLNSVSPITPSTWVDHCARALGYEHFEDHKQEISETHLLLSFFYAMQPGVFSLSSADLFGRLPPLNPNLGLASQEEPRYLYDPLPIQMTSPNSFARKLRDIISARNTLAINMGTLLSVLPSPHPGTLLLISRLPDHTLHLLAMNFSRKTVREKVEMAELSDTYAIETLSNLAEDKVISSSTLVFSLAPLSGKSIYFKKKYYK